MTTQAQVQGLGEFAGWGFTLEHDGAIAVFLLHEGELVDRFSQTGATEESLQEECANHLVMKHGWPQIITQDEAPCKSSLRGEMDKKEVTQEQFLQALAKHEDEVYHMELKAWQMPILHGLIALAADHPGIQERGWPTKDLITQVRWWCREKFSEWGFSPEEVEYLDTMRELAQGNITDKSDMTDIISGET